ncbi:MAG: hypothetical protein ABIP75_04515 [Pyrinomonadaceae bacterium]
MRIVSATVFPAPRLPKKMKKVPAEVAGGTAMGALPAAQTRPITVNEARSQERRVPVPVPSVTENTTRNLE